jgi:hypothetical protein
MVRHTRKRKGKHCQAFFDPDPWNVGHQHFCAPPPCRQASKAARQSCWLHKPHNRAYFHGPAHVQRVRQGRQAPRGMGDARPRRRNRRDKSPSARNRLWSLASSLTLPAWRDKMTSP